MEFRIWPQNKWLSMIRLLLIGVLLFLITVYLINGGQARTGIAAKVAAKVWHWRHGYSTHVGDYVVPVPDHNLQHASNSRATHVGDYVVPVPDHWLVETREDRRTITLVDTRGRRTSDPLSGINVMDVVALNNPIRDSDSWTAIWRSA